MICYLIVLFFMSLKKILIFWHCLSCALSGCFPPPPYRLLHWCMFVPPVPPVCFLSWISIHEPDGDTWICRRCFRYGRGLLGQNVRLTTNFPPYKDLVLHFFYA